MTRHQRCNLVHDQTKSAHDNAGGVGKQPQKKQLQRTKRAHEVDEGVVELPEHRHLLGIPAEELLGIVRRRIMKRDRTVCHAVHELSDELGARITQLVRTT